MQRHLAFRGRLQEVDLSVDEAVGYLDELLNIRLIGELVAKCVTRQRRPRRIQRLLM